MSSIANLIVSMIAETGAFTSDIKKASRTTAAEMKKMERAASESGRALGVAFLAAAAAATAMVVKTVNAADRIKDLSVQTGISAESLSKFSHIAEQSGVSFDALTGGIGKMQRSLIEARDSTSQSADMFSRLGLSVSDLLKLSPEKQFESVAEAISNLGTAAERTAAAQAIFGRSGIQLLPVLAEGAEGIRKIGDEVERYGGLITTDLANAADQFNDNLGKLKLVATGVANEFTSGLLPTLIEMQEELLESGDAMNIARDAGKFLGETAEKLAHVLKFLAENATLVEIAFGGYLGLKILTPLLLALGPTAALAATAIGLVTAAAIVFSSESKNTETTLSDLKESIKGVTDEWLKNASASQLAAKATELNDSLVKTMRELAEAEVQLGIAQGALGLGTSITAAGVAELQAKVDRLRQATIDATLATTDIQHQIVMLGKETAGTVKPVIALGSNIKNLAKLSEVHLSVTKDQVDWVNRLSSELEDQLEAQDAYNEKLQDFVDIADPIGALMREFARNVNDANLMLQRGDITLQQYQDGLNALSDGLGKAAAGMKDTAAETSAMTEAMLEGVRILERSFTSMWEKILDRSKGTFDGMLDGFKTMLANMTHQLTTGKIAKELGSAFDIDPSTTFDFGNFATGVAGALGVAIGSALGGGGTGAGIGAMVGGAIGSIWGPIGTAIGSLLGGLVGGLFDKTKLQVLQASGVSNAGASASDLDTVVNSVFGQTFLRSRRLDDAAIQAVKDSIVDFDKAIGSFLDDNQISAITSALATFDKTISEETISIEQLLAARFNAILTTFSGDIQDFVNKAEDLEERVTRLQIGAGIERLFKEQPDVLGAHTVKDFMTVVEAFKVGVEDIGEAFTRFAQILQTVVNVKVSLKDFGSSDLAADFDAMLQLATESVIATLSRTSSDLFDAITNFDGSPEQLVEIGNLALSVRQQELNALSLIDSVAKGLNASLDRLLADTQATISGPRKAEDVLFDARALIATVSQAGTPEEIAKIGQEFEALIRSLSPEDTKAFGTSTLAIIEAFKQASNTALEQAKQAVLDSGAAIRQMVDGFADLLDPLTIIANSNERAAAALEAIASGQIPQETDGGVTNAVINSESINAAFEDGLADQSAVLEEGTTQMTNALRTGVSAMAGQLANAIRTGFAGANVQVNVVVQDQGLVTQ